MDSIPISSLELICLGSSVALSGLFFYIYRRKSKTVGKLKDAPMLPLDEQLVAILNATPGKCLRYVIIEGAVQPLGEPLRSQYQENCFGVIQKLILKEHKLVWNNIARNWMDSEKTLHQRVYTVPFDLVTAHAGGSVRVLSPLEASSLHLEVVHEKFHQAMHGFSEIIGHYLSGEKPKGVLETEEMVKVGAVLTGVGELILDTDGVVKLRPPSDGSEYFLSPLDFESLLGEQEGHARVWRVLAALCGLAGAAILLAVAWRHYKRLREKREREERRREFERMSLGGLGVRQSAGEEEEERDAEITENACVICLSRPRGCVLLNCGHVCCCFRCYQALPSPNCPICRSAVSRVVPLYQA
ncbi:mitochondrial ubiquitin ligase activator of nfkb 1-A-like isoform X1 [Acipenser oxyrinchus oxyrinchus]|uniref:RING-type E3 ubiquitin transferase n=1 Tax=Acipenser oxyrinchus oxyrinchus TaxID=40147 RepID=A0AAD8DES2_ACIOX|nr:mitochondrial ubiquitin ligase activator of nfkb 1-A-like isoform X1 [Acipenser oxyrinchus oxyrinchus]